MVAVNGLLLDLGLALRAHTTRERGAGGHRCRRHPGRHRGGRRHPLRTHHHRPPPGGDAPGRRRAAPARRAGEPAAHREALRAGRPAAWSTTTSSCSRSRRSTPTPSPIPSCGPGWSRSPKNTTSSVLVNARTPGDDDQSRNTNLLYTPDRQAAGDLLEAAPRALRRVRALARRAELAPRAAAGALRLRTRRRRARCSARAVTRSSR